MKFTDMKYIRPDVQIILSEYNDIIKDFTNADSYQNQIKCINNHEKLIKSFKTMQTLAHIRHTIDTKDEYYTDEYNFIMSSSPIIEEKVQVLYKNILESKYLNNIKEHIGEMFISNIKISMETFSKDIIHLLQEENALKVEYQNLIASLRVNFNGETLNLASLTPYKSNENRDIRKKAFFEEGLCLKNIKPDLDRIFDKLINIRHNIAKLLGHDSFIPVGYSRMGRDCYNEKDVEIYRQNIINLIVPFLKKIKKQQSKRISIEDMKIYDDTFSFKDGNAKPFGSFDDTIQAGKKMYTDMSNITKDFINFMLNNELFDLISTPNKAAGGYCTFIYDHKSPFIYSNFNGTSGDVDVFTHEAGHALAGYLTKDEKICEIKSPNLETCEVHSMAMEYFAWPWLELFYKDDVKKAKLSQIEHSINFLPYGTMVDHFQHILYNNPKMSSNERDKKWLELEKIYRPYMDFDDIPFYKDGSGWQRQLHIYMTPFYYIDYCLAETMALQFWSLSQKDFENTFNKYIEFVKIGGNDNFINSINKVNLNSPFKQETIEKIIENIDNFINHQ